MPKSNTQLHKL